MKIKIGELKEAIQLKAIRIENDSVRLSIKSPTGEVEELWLAAGDTVSLNLSLVKSMF